MMGPLATLSSVLGLSLTSGINLYATVAVVGLVTKFDLIKGLPPEFEAFDNGFLIALAIFLYAIEFVADKVPAIDTTWDSVHTFIRPAGAAYIATTMVGDASAPVEVAAALLGGALGLSTHTAKAGARLAVNTSPEPFSNAVVSVAEDIGVVGMVLLVMAHPYIALAVSVIILTLLIVFGPGLWRGALLLIKAFATRIATIFVPGREAMLMEDVPDTLELAVDDALSKNEKVVARVACFARKIKGCGRNRKGALAVTDNRLLFAYRKLFRTRLASWEKADVERAAFVKKFLVDMVRVKVTGRFLVFVFLKNRSATAKELAETVEGLTGQPEPAPSPAAADAGNVETAEASES